MGHVIEKKAVKVFIGEFRGSKIFELWPVNNSGEKSSQRPLISFGKGKAEAILDNIEELKKFVDIN